MRGKAAKAVTPQITDRITPAYAGKRFRIHITRIITWDHPRLCGEKRSMTNHFENLSGSPPPMRGKVISHCRQPARLRITPAYAGKSYFHEHSPRKSRDHPRLCGEKGVLLAGQFWKWGSPPPMRGKVLKGCLCRYKDRITPAYAGKRVSLLAFAMLVWDHPRLCGEKSRQWKNP